MDQAITQWINSPAGTNGLLDAVMIMAGNHYLMHAGQFVATRRKANKPVVI